MCWTTVCSSWVTRRLTIWRVRVKECQAEKISGKIWSTCPSPSGSFWRGRRVENAWTEIRVRERTFCEISSHRWLSESHRRFFERRQNHWNHQNRVSRFHLGRRREISQITHEATWATQKTFAHRGAKFLLEFTGRCFLWPHRQRWHDPKVFRISWIQFHRCERLLRWYLEKDR